MEQLLDHPRVSNRRVECHVVGSFPDPLHLFPHYNDQDVEGVSRDP